jgi:hypothetical protein
MIHVRTRRKNYTNGIGRVIKRDAPHRLRSKLVTHSTHAVSNIEIDSRPVLSGTSSDRNMLLRLQGSKEKSTNRFRMPLKAKVEEIGDHNGHCIDRKY